MAGGRQQVIFQCIVFRSLKRNNIGYLYYISLKSYTSSCDIYRRMFHERSIQASQLLETYLRLQQLLSGSNIIGELGLLQLLCEGSQGGTDLLGVGAELLHCLQPEGCGGFREGRDTKRTCHHTPIRPQTKASLPSSNGRKSDIFYFVKSEETLWREYIHECWNSHLNKLSYIGYKCYLKSRIAYVHKQSKELTLRDTNITKKQS